MSPFLIPILALLIPVVAILSGTYVKVMQMKAETDAQLGRAAGHVDDELAEARAERDRLRQRVEALEAIVTSEGYDLEREARRAGLGQIDTGLLDLPGPQAAERDPRRRTRES